MRRMTLKELQSIRNLKIAQMKLNLIETLVARIKCQTRSRLIFCVPVYLTVELLCRATLLYISGDYCILYYSQREGDGGVEHSFFFFWNYGVSFIKICLPATGSQILKTQNLFPKHNPAMNKPLLLSNVQVFLQIFSQVW